MIYHPVEALLDQIPGCHISRVFVGISGLDIQFSREINEGSGVGKNPFGLWIQCNVRIGVGHSEVMRTTYPLANDEPMFIKLLLERRVKHVRFNPKGCSIRIRFDDDAYLSIVPSCRIEENPWVIFGRMVDREVNCVVFSDYYSGEWR